jgi:YggT family protein
MATVVAGLLNLLVLVFVARALVSWFRVGPDSSMWPVVNGLYRITEPVLAPIRRVLPPMGGLDLSVLVVILGIQFVVVPIVYRLLS